MDIQGITTSISTIGFPIVCCLIMMYYVREQEQKNREEIEKLNEKYDENIASLNETVNNNTLALQRLTDKLDIRMLQKEGENN